MSESSASPQEGPVELSRPQVEDVFEATEGVRAAEFPTVPADLLAAVLTAERDNPDSRPDAARAVQRAVDSYLADHPAESSSTATDAEGGTSS